MRRQQEREQRRREQEEKRRIEEMERRRKEEEERRRAEEEKRRADREQVWVKYIIHSYIPIIWISFSFCLIDLIISVTSTPVYWPLSDFKWSRKKYTVLTTWMWRGVFVWQEYIRRQLEEEQRHLEILQQQLLHEQAMLLVSVDGLSKHLTFT